MAPLDGVLPSDQNNSGTEMFNDPNYGTVSQRTSSAVGRMPTKKKINGTMGLMITTKKKKNAHCYPIAMLSVEQRGTDDNSVCKLDKDHNGSGLEEITHGSKTVTFVLSSYYTCLSLILSHLPFRIKLSPW